jgi:hypothetical protein
LPQISADGRRSREVAANQGDTRIKTLSNWQLANSNWTNPFYRKGREGRKGKRRTHLCGSLLDEWEEILPEASKASTLETEDSS